MLAPTLETLPPEILSHIFSYLVFKDITTVPPSRSLLPYYQSNIYKSVFIVSASAYTSFDAALIAKPFLAKLITKFDTDFRDEDFQQSICALNLVNNIGMMSQLRWLGLGEVPQSVIALLSAETLRNSLPKLRHLNISEEYATTTTQSNLKLLSLISQLTQVSHLSVEIGYADGYAPLQVFEASQKMLNFKQKEALSLLNFDHITYLDIKGVLYYDIFTLLLYQCKYIRSLTLRIFYNVELAPISSYRHLEELYLLDCIWEEDHFSIPDPQLILQFTGLKILTIGDTSLFSQEDLSRLHSQKSLHTLNLGIEFWSALAIPDDLVMLILPDSPLQLPSLQNLNLNIRFDYQNIVYGTRWLAQELEDWEIKEWDWSECGYIGESNLQELFELAEWNKIKMGGQILEVEWPQFDKPRVLGDI